MLAGSLEEPDTADAVPTSPYAASKLGARARASVQRLMGLQVTVLRVFIVYGPGQRDVGKLVPHTILSLLRGDPPRISSGVREIDWIYLDDVVEAFLARR